MYSNNIQGWKTDEELNWLHETAKEMASILEIGCWKGKTTMALADGCTGPVVAVDPWRYESYGPPEKGVANSNSQDIFQQFLVNTKWQHNIIPVKATSVEALKVLRFGFDMIFLDGDKSEENLLSELRVCLAKAKKMIAGYDVNMEKVKKVLDKNLGQYEVFNNIWFKYL